MKNLSMLISEAIINTFAELRQNTYEGYENDFWYVIRGGTGDVFIGLKTDNEGVNKYLVRELSQYLIEELNGHLRMVYVVIGNFSDYSNDVSKFLNGDYPEIG